MHRADARKILASRLRERRTALGLSQFEVYEASGIHWNQVSAYERGTSVPTLRNLLRLAKAFGIDPCDLVTGLDPW